MFIKPAMIGAVIVLSVGGSSAYADSFGRYNPANRADCDYIQAQSRSCPSPDRCPRIVAFLNQCGANFNTGDGEQETANTTPPRSALPDVSNDPILQQSREWSNMIENPGGLSMQKSLDLAQRCGQHDKQACKDFEAWKQEMNREGALMDSHNTFMSGLNQSSEITNHVIDSERRMEYSNEAAHDRDMARGYFSEADAARRAGNERAAQEYQSRGDYFNQKAIEYGAPQR
jgi:hypothetical protein